MNAVISTIIFPTIGPTIGAVIGAVPGADISPAIGAMNSRQVNIFLKNYMTVAVTSRQKGLCNCAVKSRLMSGKFLVKKSVCREL